MSTAPEPTSRPQSWLLSEKTETELVFANARQAQRAWGALCVRQRAQQLAKAIDPLMERMDELADLVVEENGKPRVEAISHDVGGCIAQVRHLCSHAEGILAPERVSPAWMVHRTGEIRRDAYGLVVVISPWNIPLAIPFGQVFAGLIAGNAVVLKPSEVTPRIGAVIAEIVAKCNLPAGLFTVVQGDGRVGAELIAARPDKVFFTGSVATGRKVMAAASAFPIPVSLELGGVDALIVFEDADLEVASSAAAWGATFNGGQVCASVERILVHASVADRFVARTVEKLNNIVSDRDLGRITMPRQGLIYEQHLSDARRRGLDVKCGGERLANDKWSPTLIDGPDVAQSMAHTEETFGPVVTVTRFRTEADAIRQHNDTRYGLTASVFTGSTVRADRVASALKVGLVSVNDVAATLYATAEYPWGGVGESGFGRSHGAEGLLEFTRCKVIDRPRGGVPPFKRPWWYPYDADQLELLTGFTRLTGARSAAESAAQVARLTAGLVRSLIRHPRQ